MYVSDPDRQGTCRLPDGRLLGWAEWGPEHGAPVLLCPGAATSRWLGFGAAEVSALGVRLISVDRPGLGASSPHPGRTFADFAADLRGFLARRDLRRPALVGNSQGAPFALACAASGLCSALALVSAADELDKPPVDEATLAAFDAETMWRMVHDYSPESDLAVYREPGFAAAYRRALDEAFQQGSAGYVADALLAMRPWSFELSGIGCPVDVWYGAQDTSHSPDRGVRLTGRIPGARRHLVPGIGGAALWTHAGPILRTLLL